MASLQEHFLWFCDYFLTPLYHRAIVFFTPSDGLFIGYLFSALLIALLYHTYSSRKTNLRAALKDLLAAHNLRSRSVKDDVLLFFSIKCSWALSTHLSWALPFFSGRKSCSFYPMQGYPQAM
ncbi:hypothetical protein XB02_15745 [Pantoea ananatis]|nr:hypothetical protein XB02_15745 [Pantoea ananatis]